MANDSATLHRLIISRFPGLADKIFDRLDDESLVNSRTVSRSWSEFTENEMFFLKRIIEKLIGDYEDFQETWKLVMKKADLEMMNELALAVKFFLLKHPGNCSEKKLQSKGYATISTSCCCRSWSGVSL